METDHEDLWKDQSLASLKQELAKLEEVNRALRETKCASAQEEVAQKIQSLKLQIQSRMPQGQRLQVLESQHRKAQQLRQKIEFQVSEVRSRLAELEEKHKDAMEAEFAAQKSLDALRLDLAKNIAEEEEAFQDTDAEINMRLSELQQQVPTNLLSQLSALRAAVLKKKAPALPTPADAGDGAAPTLPPTVPDTGNQAVDEDAGSSQSVLAVPAKYEAAKSASTAQRSEPYAENQQGDSGKGKLSK